MGAPPGDESAAQPIPREGTRPGRLVLGLGNPLAGDDGVGVRLAQSLARDPRLPAGVEVRTGTDLLRLHEALRNRSHVLLLDACPGPEPPGTLLRFSDVNELDDASAGAHRLSPVAALKLLRAVDPRIRDVPVTILAVVVRESRVSDRLSSQLEERLDALVDQVLDALAAWTA